MQPTQKDQAPLSKMGRLNVQIGDQKRELAKAAAKHKTTQTQLLKDAIRTHLILLKHARSGSVTLIGKDGQTIEVKL